MLCSSWKQVWFNQIVKELHQEGKTIKEVTEGTLFTEDLWSKTAHSDPRYGLSSVVHVRAASGSRTLSLCSDQTLVIEYIHLFPQQIWWMNAFFRLEEQICGTERIKTYILCIDYPPMNPKQTQLNIFGMPHLLNCSNLHFKDVTLLFWKQL